MPMNSICAELGVGIPLSGGWIQSSFNLLRERVTLRVASVYGGETVREITDGNVTHYAVPSRLQSEVRHQPELEGYLREIILKVKPDVIHIHGTESPLSLAAMNASPDSRFVVSIQGLVSVYALHYFCGLYNETRVFNLRKLLTRTGIESQCEKMRLRGRNEIAVLKRTKHIIGRTSWDRACAMQINPGAEYHFCNETLRKSFYEGDRWDLSSCVRHRIFVGHAYSPIKGFHFVLKALPEIIKRFPDTQVHVVGANPSVREGSLISRMLRITDYEAYLKRLVRDHKLEKYITFTGMLGADEMKREFLEANVFVSASAIENSPNSLGEAMILGVPCVASFVGGVPDMLPPDAGFLYQSDAPYMLAHYVCEVFSNDNKAAEMSEKAKKAAEVTHSREINIGRLVDIYGEITGC